MIPDNSEQIYFFDKKKVDKKKLVCYNYPVLGTMISKDNKVQYFKKSIGTYL